MEKIITYDQLDKYAYSNDRICKMPLKGIVLEFFGLGCMSMFDEDTDMGRFFADQGILYVIPYNNPWAWMNRQAVEYTDEIVDVLVKRYQLDDIPIVATGGSMGGQSALVYMTYAKRTPVACVVNCPVCDMPYHFTERPDLPRTLYSALFHEASTMEEALRAISPLHLAAKMPPAAYHIFHCGEDESVNIIRHSETFVAEMKKQYRDITYDVVSGRGHCDLTEEMWQQYRNYICESILQ